MSADPLIDVIPIMKREQDGAIITQFDYPPLRDARPDQDGLPRAAQPHDHRRRAADIKTNRGDDLDLEDLDLDDAADLRPAGPRRHPRRVPARRRRRCGRCCADEARQLRGHLRRHRAVPARARWARTRTPTTRCARTGSQEITPIHPELDEPLREILGEHLRPDRLPGAGHGDRAEGRRLHARPGRHAAPRDGQEEEVRAGQAVRRLLGRACRTTATRWRRSRRCGTSCCRSPTTRSTRRTRAAYGVVSLLDRVPEGATTRPSTWRRCSRASGDDKDKLGALPQRVPPDGHQGAAAGRQRVER